MMIHCKNCKKKFYHLNEGDELEGKVIQCKYCNEQWLYETKTKYLESRLSELNELILPYGPDVIGDNFDTYQNYELQAENRNKLQAYLKDNEVGTLIQWGGTAIHQFTNLGFNQDCPNTEKFFENCIMLPMNIFISDEDVHYVCDKVKEFYRK